MAYDTLAPKETVAAIIPKLKERGIEAEIVDTKEQAFERLKELIPQKAALMTGGSTTLKEIGFTDFLESGTHPWHNLKDDIMAEKDPTKQSRLRKEATLADYFVGSIHAITTDGQIFVASASGSQIPSYAFSSPNVIWVVGTQKIVPNSMEGMKRVQEYVYPLEDARMKSVGQGGSVIAKWLGFEREPAFTGRKIHLIFVNEKLGF